MRCYLIHKSVMPMIALVMLVLIRIWVEAEQALVVVQQDSVMPLAISLVTSLVVGVVHGVGRKSIAVQTYAIT